MTGKNIFLLFLLIILIIIYYKNYFLIRENFNSFTEFKDNFTIITDEITKVINILKKI